MAEVTMPMNGKVINVLVNIGDSVQEDQDLVIIEAMKMELPIVAVRERSHQRNKSKSRRFVPSRRCSCNH